MFDGLRLKHLEDLITVSFNLLSPHILGPMICIIFKGKAFEGLYVSCVCLGFIKRVVVSKFLMKYSNNLLFEAFKYMTS